MLLKDKMGNNREGKIPFRPYARLISVLGDQLISDKWVGVIELVKNSYDADAEEVEVKFLDFDEDNNPQTIEIRDDGCGMTIDDVLDKWMKPATPHKLNKKKKGELRYTPEKKRVMQGDKGVGRFAIYKLGDHIELYTKTKSTNEVYLELDFEEYADDKFEESGHVDRFLDEIENDWRVNDSPQEIKNKKNKGTLIRISKLRNDWKEKDLEKLAKAFFQMIPPVLPKVNVPQDFQVSQSWGDKIYVSDDYSIKELLADRPFYFEGYVDENGVISARYVHNTKEKEITLNLFDLKDDNFWKYSINEYAPFQEQFLKVVDSSIKTKKFSYDNIELVKQKPEVGEFMFFYFGYDLLDQHLSASDKKKLRETSVYLFRDNVRVYPYGEKGNDWLELSKKRGEKRAGDFFSYNDLIGFVFITQEDNPDLRDAADREGLMNVNGKKDDFVALLSTTLKVMKDEVDIDKARIKLKKDKPFRTISDKFGKAYEIFQNELTKDELDQQSVLKKAKILLDATNALVKKSKDDVQISLELAGTGMAVEKATHDTLTLLQLLRKNSLEISKKVENQKISVKELKDFFDDLESNLDFIYQELSVLQPLLRVARKVTKEVSIKETAERIKKYFKRELQEGIEFQIIGDDFTVLTNTGLILQILLNLTDNSIYWLNQNKIQNKTIKLELDAENQSFIFADNGKGIDKEIKELVFTEFYSTKSEGRGLGLYIAKELLSRIDAEIFVSSNKILEGANIEVKFNTEE